MAKTLTIKAIEAAKPKEAEYKLTVVRGLYIRVATNGIKTWLVRYVIDGKQIQFKLPKPFATSSDGGYMSLADAITLNANIQVLARTGIDYQIQQSENLKQKKADTEAERASNLTFQDLFDAWIKDGVSRTDGNEMILRTFKNHALPTLGDIPLRDLSENNLLDTLRAVFNQNKTRTAIMLHKDIGQMLRWAEKRKPYRALMIDGNPAELVDIENLIPIDYEEERDRILSNDEIRKLNSIFTDGEIAYKEAANKYEAVRPLIKETQIALWLCLSTLSRIGELLMTEWKHIDFEARTWFIPKENVKGTRRNKQEQLVYLSDFALDKFKQLHKITGDSKWAFPAAVNSKKHNENHVCVKSVSKQVGDRQTQFKKRTKDLSKRANNNTLVLGEEDWTPHDLRRTGATMMQELGISLDVIDRCQNHVLAGGKVRRHYLHHEYINEKREAWQKLGERLKLVFTENVLIGNFNKAA